MLYQHGSDGICQIVGSVLFSDGKCQCKSLPTSRSTAQITQVPLLLTSTIVISLVRPTLLFTANTLNSCLSPVNRCFSPILINYYIFYELYYSAYCVRLFVLSWQNYTCLKDGCVYNLYAIL